VLIGGLGADDRIGDACDIVVLHILADAAQLVHDGDADAPEMVGFADTRQLQEVRRADGTRRQDHLAHRIGRSTIQNYTLLCCIIVDRHHLTEQLAFRGFQDGCDFADRGGVQF
jgi:hypothetical protein